MEREEDKLSAFSLHVVTTIAMLENLAEEHDSIAECLKNMTLMFGTDAINDALQGAIASAVALRELKDARCKNVADWPEEDAMNEFMDKMRLHYMWVPR